MRTNGPATRAERRIPAEVRALTVRYVINHDLAKGLPPSNVFGIDAVGVKDQPRSQRAGDDGGDHGDGDPEAGKDERRQIKLHGPSIFPSGRATEVGPKGTTTLGRRRLLVLVGALVASACAPAALARPTAPSTPIPPLAANPTRGIWPSQYHSAPRQVRDAYTWAAGHENILSFIPCFCGCGANGHKNNFDCFVESRQTSGWITMDLHGLNCGTCVAITLETASMTEKGLTVRQMRTAIDARWSATGPSTPTPLP
jgi:uncharacterized protein with PCYCGC motif